MIEIKGLKKAALKAAEQLARRNVLTLESFSPRFEVYKGTLHHD